MIPRFALSFHGNRLRILVRSRVWNIALRTAHLATMGILLGGHAFHAAPEDLRPALWWCLGTGIALAAVEAGPRLLWFHQGRGLMTLAKLVLIAAVPCFWDYRLPILVAVVVIASVGSHAPARFRYYSVLYRTVIRCGSGPGVSRLDGDRSDPDEENGAE
jgi:hypothetical protein